MDVYGRPVTENPAPAETDPTVIEIERLEEGPIGRARRNDLLVNGERRDLTDEEFQRYQELSGRYILEDMRAVMAAPGYDNLPDEDRQAVLRQVVRDQRRNAREELFSGAPQGDELIEAPTGPNQARPAQGGSQGPTGGDEYLGSADEGASIIREIFPGVEVTDNIRDPDSPLGRRNPSSRHIHSTMAVDVRPIPGMTFREYIRRIREAGYTIRESRDEVTNPVSWATGPHWHVEIGERR